MLHLHQPVFSVPRVGRQVAARLFDGQLVAIGVVRVRGRAGDIRGVQQSVGTVIGQRRDIQGHRFRLRPRRLGIRLLGVLPDSAAPADTGSTHVHEKFTQWLRDEKLARGLQKIALLTWPGVHESR